MAKTTKIDLIKLDPNAPPKESPPDPEVQETKAEERVSWIKKVLLIRTPKEIDLLRSQEDSLDQEIDLPLRAGGNRSLGRSGCGGFTSGLAPYPRPLPGA